MFLIVATAAARRSAAEAGRDGAKTVKADTFTGMSLQEAKQVLDVQDLDDLEQIRKVCLLTKSKNMFDNVPTYKLMYTEGMLRKCGVYM